MDYAHASRAARQTDGPASATRVHHVGLATATKLGGAKLVGGGGAIFGMERALSSPYRSVLGRTGLWVESERHQQAHSASCVAPMA
jgi:hypothetical protein